MNKKPGQEQQHEKVGYCNPPQGTRFKQGQSGNPAGRPKGSLNLNTVLLRTLNEPIVIKESGKRRSVSKLEALLTKLVNKSVAGNVKATQIISAMVRAAEEQQNESELPTILSASDQEILREAQRRKLKMPVQITVVRGHRTPDGEFIESEPSAGGSDNCGKAAESL